MSFFTLDATADDQWIDVKTKEEVLKSELDKTKQDLESHQHKLDVTSLEVDLLKGHKTNLETLRDDLQCQLQRRDYEISKTGKDLEEISQGKEFLQKEFTNMKETMEQKNMTLENSLSSCKSKLEDSQGEITKLRADLKSSNSSRERETKTAGDEITNLKQLVKDMERKVSALQSESSNDKRALDEAKKQIKVQQVREEQLRKDVSTTNTAMTEKKTQLDEAHRKLGAVALLSEELKRDKQTLERSLKTKEEEMKAKSHDLEQSKSREVFLTQEMENLRLTSENSINELMASLSSQTDTLEDRKDRIEYLQQVLEGFKTQHEIMEQKLQEAQAILDRERNSNEELRAEKSDLETELMNQEMKFAEQIEKTKATSSNRMVELQEESDYQRIRSAQRSRELNQILGEGFLSSIVAFFNSFPLEYPHVKIQ